MNKFIKYDIHNGLTLLKCAIMNVLESFEKEEEFYYNFDEIPLKLLIKCLTERRWEIGSIKYNDEEYYIYCSYNERPFVIRGNVLGEIRISIDYDFNVS